MFKLLETFGKKIKDYRKLRNLSQETLAEKLDVTSKTISQWERGKSFIKIETFYKLCEVLDIKEEDLLSFPAIKTGNAFIDQLNKIAINIPPARQEQVIQILKTFVEQEQL